MNTENHTEPDLPDDEPPTPRGLPVPSDRAIRIVALVSLLLAVALIVYMGSRLFVLTQHDSDRAEQIGELRGQNTAQDRALAEANRRLEQAGEPQVSVPDPAEGQTITAGMLEAALEAYCGDCLGPRGLTGPAGSSGVEGKRGPRGFTGLDSAVPGPRGPAGADSTTPGPRGEQGPPGPPGPKGEPGVDGTDGKDGAAGEQGPPGVVNVVDACNPPAGDVVTDNSIDYDAGTITLTCTSEPQILP